MLVLSTIQYMNNQEDVYCALILLSSLLKKRQTRLNEENMEILFGQLEIIYRLKQALIVRGVNLVLFAIFYSSQYGTEKIFQFWNNVLDVSSHLEDIEGFILLMEEVSQNVTSYEEFNRDMTDTNFQQICQKLNN